MSSLSIKSQVPFNKLYSNVDRSIVNSLQSFRQSNTLNKIRVDSVTWEYIAVGQGQETILFLHGMTGTYDIWQQQIEVLKERYRIISVTYPPVRSLEKLTTGVLFILENEGIADANIVGTSLGGYFTQYLIARYSERVQQK